jgi:hypothetical protein
MTALPILNVQVETGWRKGFCGHGARPNLTDEIDAYPVKSLNFESQGSTYRLRGIAQQLGKCFIPILG